MNEYCRKDLHKLSAYTKYPIATAERLPFIDKGSISLPSIQTHRLPTKGGVNMNARETTCKFKCSLIERAVYKYDFIEIYITSKSECFAEQEE